MMKDNILGSCFGILSFTALAFVNILNKYLFGTTHINTWHISYWRGLTMFGFNLSVCLYQKISPFDIKKEYSTSLFFRALFGAAGQVMNTFQFALLSLSKAQAMYYTYPLWTAIISWVLLKERLTKYDILSILSAFAGVIILIFNRKTNEGNAFKVESPYGVPVALIGTFFIGIGDTYSRKIGNNISCYVTPSYLGLFLSMMNAFLILFIDPDFRAIKDYSLKTAMILVAICLLSWLFMLFLTKAYQLEKAARIAFMVYIQIVFSAAVDVFYFGNSLDALEVLGIVFIISGNFIVLLLKCMNVIQS